MFCLFCFVGRVLVSIECHYGVHEGVHALASHRYARLSSHQCMHTTTDSDEFLVLPPSSSILDLIQPGGCAAGAAYLQVRRWSHNCERYVLLEQLLCTHPCRVHTVFKRPSNFSSIQCTGQWASGSRHTTCPSHNSPPAPPPPPHYTPSPSPTSHARGAASNHTQDDMITPKQWCWQMLLGILIFTLGGCCLNMHHSGFRMMRR